MYRPSSASHITSWWVNWDNNNGSAVLWFCGLQEATNQRSIHRTPRPWSRIYLSHNNKCHCFWGSCACWFPLACQFFINGHVKVFPSRMHIYLSPIVHVDFSILVISLLPYLQHHFRHGIQSWYLANLSLFSKDRLVAQAPSAHQIRVLEAIGSVKHKGSGLWD